MISIAFFGIFLVIGFVLLGLTVRDARMVSAPPDREVELARLQIDIRRLERECGMEELRHLTGNSTYDKIKQW
jgi:hypothetical protein